MSIKQTKSLKRLKYENTNYYKNNLDVNFCRYGDFDLNVLRYRHERFLDMTTYIHQNCSCSNKIIFKENFITEDNLFRIEISKRRPEENNNAILYFFSIYDNTFSRLKESCFDPSRPNYDGRLLGIDIRDNDIDTRYNEMQTILSNIQYFCQTGQETTILLHRHYTSQRSTRECKKSNNILIRFNPVYLNINPTNIPMYYHKLVNMRITRYITPRSIDKDLSLYESKYHDKINVDFNMNFTINDFYKFFQLLTYAKFATDKQE